MTSRSECDIREMFSHERIPEHIHNMTPAQLSELTDFSQPEMLFFCTRKNILNLPEVRVHH